MLFRSELGSTRIKACLIGPNAEVLAVGSHEWENVYADKLWTYSLDAVWSGLQAAYAEATGVKALKIKHNNILGYFIEVTAQQADVLRASPAAADFIHRQTIASAVRFTTVELGGLEQKIALAGARVLALEIEIFNALSIRRSCVQPNGSSLVPRSFFIRASRRNSGHTHAPYSCLTGAGVRMFGSIPCSTVFTQFSPGIGLRWLSEIDTNGEEAKVENTSTNSRTSSRPCSVVTYGTFWRENSASGK